MLKVLWVCTRYVTFGGFLFSFNQRCLLYTSTAREVGDYLLLELVFSRAI